VTTFRSRRQRTAVDQVLAKAAAVRPLLAADGARLHAALDLMEEFTDTGIRAARLDDGTASPAMWCEVHERDLARCPADQLCTGRSYRPGADIVGERAAGGQRDQAAEDRGRVLKLLEARARLDAQLVELVAGYERRHGTSTLIGPAAGWCTSCYRNDHQHEPVGTRPDGRPYYIGLCRWCGDFRAAHGQQLPPLDLLKARHSGKQITTTMVKLALAGHKKRKKR
jgi:hypothetical protein